MGSRVWSISSLPPLLALSILYLGSGSATANPVGPVLPVVGTGLVLLNFGLNGFLLLGLYYLIGRYVNLPEPLGWGPFMSLFLGSVAIISFTGAVIDLAVWRAGSLAPILVGALLIGFIVTLVSWRYLRLTFVGGVVVGAAFSLVNLGSWFYLTSMYIFPLDFLTMAGVFTALAVALMFIAAIVATDLHSRPADDGAWQAGPGTVSTEGPFQGTGVSEGLVTEILGVAGILGLFVVWLSIF